MLFSKNTLNSFAHADELIKPALLPDGKYTLKIEDMVTRTNSKGNGEYVKCTFSVDGYPDKKIFAIFNTVHESIKAVEIGIKNFSQLCECVGLDIKALTTTEDFINRRVGGVIGHKDAVDKYPAQNIVVSYYKLSGLDCKILPSNTPIQDMKW